MVGQKKPGTGKKKGKKKGEGAHIAAAIMPTATLAAVPRSPPPPPLEEFPDVDLGLSSGVLSGSLLGQMFITSESIDIQSSETDTSLYDYENTRDNGMLMYSTVEKAVHDSTLKLSSSWPDSRDRLATPELTDASFDGYTDNEAGPSRSPSPNPGRGSPHYHAVNESPRTSAPSAEPVYSVVKKPKAKNRHSNGSDLTYVSSVHEEMSPQSTSMRHYEEEDDRVLQSHTSTIRSRPHTPSPRTRTPSPHISLHRSPSPEIYEYDQEDGVAEHTFVKSYDNPSPKPLNTLKIEELSHTMSPRLNELERQNVELLQKQEALQKLLHQQNEEQQEILKRLQQQTLMATQRSEHHTLTQEMESLLQETQSVTEGTMKHQEDLLRSFHQRTEILEQEKRELRDLNEQLQAEIISLRRLTSIKDSDEPQGMQTMMLKKQLQDYKDEKNILKTAVHKLSVELSHYQGKYRPPDAETSDMAGLPTKGPKPSWLINTRYLGPLFLAYDDRLQEKDQIIQHYEEEIESFSLRVDEIVKENQRLHLRLEQTDVSGPVSMTEWKQLQEQCKLVLEENQLLMEQLDVQENKAKNMHKAHVQEVSKLSKRVVAAEADRNALDSEVEELRNKLSSVKQKHDYAVIENNSRMDMEEHVTTVSKIKRNLEDAKLKHAHELENMNTKLQSVQMESKSLQLEVDDLHAQIKQLESESKEMRKAHRKDQRKILVLQKALGDAESKEHSASHYLTSMVKVAEQTAMERDTFVHVVQTQEKQNKKAINRLMEGNVAVGRMEEKLKLVKLKASEKLEKAVHRMKQQDQDFNQVRAEYERELKHMRTLLREREEMLDSVAGEKRQVEDDLEIVWQTASADNRRMRETLRKSVRKLKEHASLDILISESEDDHEALILSDSEK